MSGKPDRSPRMLHLAGLAIALAYPLLDRFTGWGVTEPLVTVAIFAILAVGLDAVVGLAGLLHLGFAAFFAIGAYATGILSSPSYPFGLPIPIAVAGSVLLASSFGALTALPVLRLRGDYLAIVTLGVGEIVPVLLRYFDKLTMGESGISPIGSPVLVRWLESSPQRMGWAPYAWYYLAVAACALAAFCQRRIERSRVGRAWEAFREDELGAGACGLNTALVRVQVMAWSGALAGLAGGLYASYAQVVIPSQFEFAVSAMVLSLVVLGGLGNFRGAIWGAVLIVGFDRILAPALTRWAQSAIGAGSFYAELSNYRFFLFGLALVVVMRLRPEGLFPRRRAAGES